jgi:peptide/nickel transport system permease protein
LGLGIFSPKIIMPAFILSLGPIGGITRLMRSSTLEVVNQDFVRTARAKGLPEGAVRVHHIGRNAVLPIFTVVGLSLASLVEGGFISETLFGIPGIGRLAVESFFARDYPVIMAMTLLVATAYILANLIVDIGYTFLDPRIRLH